MFDFKWRWYTWVALILLLGAIPLGLIVPLHWGWENGVLETAQMVLLVLGACVSYKTARSFPIGHRMRKFWYWTIPVWALVFTRELSFGRSLFPYFETAGGGRQEMDFWSLWRILGPVAPWNEEPLYPLREEMLIGDAIYLFIFPVAVVTIIALVRYFDWKNFKNVIRIPVVLVILFVVGGSLVEIIEREVIPAEITGTSDSQCELFEECSELAGYWCLVFIVYANAFTKFQADEAKIIRNPEKAEQNPPV